MKLGFGCRKRCTFLVCFGLKFYWLVLLLFWGNILLVYSVSYFFFEILFFF